MSGESKYRELWLSNALSTDQNSKIHGFVFVVDCSDKMRIRVAKSELEIILQNPLIPAQLPFLFYANKTDIKGSATLEEVQELMELSKLKRDFQICCCSGLTGKGI